MKPCQFCGFEFDHELLGKYGCPNCGSKGLKKIMTIAEITKYVQVCLQVEKIPGNIARQVQSTSVHVTLRGVQIRIVAWMPKNPGGQNYACFYLGEWMEVAEIDEVIGEAVKHYAMLKGKRDRKRKRRRGG